MAAKLQPCGNFSPTAAPHGCYRCKGADQWCVIAIQSEDEWMRFCDIAGHREWLTDHRFSEPAARVAYRQELDYWIGEWTAKYTPHQVMMLLQREGIAAAAAANGRGSIPRSAPARARLRARSFPSANRLGDARRAVRAHDRSTVSRRAARRTSPARTTKRC